MQYPQGQFQEREARGRRGPPKSYTDIFVRIFHAVIQHRMGIQPEKHLHSQLFRKVLPHKNWPNVE